MPMANRRRLLPRLALSGALALLGWAIFGSRREPPAPTYDWPAELWVVSGPLAGGERAHLRPGDPGHGFIHVNADLSSVGRVELFWTDELRPARPVLDAILQGADTGVASTVTEYRRSGARALAGGREFERLIRCGASGEEAGARTQR
jgi:hypothetical protein